MPFAWLSIEQTRSRRSLKILLCFGMKSFGPLSASTDAHCDTAEGFEVDCDWIIAIAVTGVPGPWPRPAAPPLAQSGGLGVPGRLHPPRRLTRGPGPPGKPAAPAGHAV